MKKNIVWLASYPKSGNTWTRVFLANYLANPSEPLPINDVYKFGMGDSMASAFFRVAGRKFNTGDTELVSKLREKVLYGIAGNNADVNFVKTHHGHFFANHRPLIPQQFTKSAVYIVRNPLDMVISYAKHFGKSLEIATDEICNKKTRLGADETTVGNFLSSWDEHVTSWLNPHPYPVLVLKYEDMLANPTKEFGKVLNLIGMPIDEERLERCVKFASFKEVKKQEEKAGFIEQSKRASGSFFSKGTSGYWKEDLDPELVQKIRKVNSKNMKRLGYYNV